MIGLCVRMLYLGKLLLTGGLGAVALPDGRVLICGGEMLTRKKEGVSFPSICF